MCLLVCKGGLDLRPLLPGSATSRGVSAISMPEVMSFFILRPYFYFISGISFVGQDE